MKIWVQIIRYNFLKLLHNYFYTYLLISLSQVVLDVSAMIICFFMLDESCDANLIA